jgi:pimeloyl-ACP methyl ester carboxylesterase
MPASVAAGVTRPRLEGSLAVRGGRRLSFATFGSPYGQPVVWMHGTPGARRQIPLEARAYAEQHNLRIVGIDRPGIGTSTQHQYTNLLDWTKDLELVADGLGLPELHMIGLSGGGPYALAAGAGLPDRVKSVTVIGGVAPTVGPDAIGGGLVALASALRPVLRVGRVPLGMTLYQVIRMLRPVAGPAIDLYATLSPSGDRDLLRRPEFRAMFLDDLLHGSRRQLSAPLLDLLLFTKDWGFDLADVKVPVTWWHGDADHIVPHAHGEHTASRLPNATFHTMEGESHLGGLGLAEQILRGLAD